jgi:hypothetical protein
MVLCDGEAKRATLLVRFVILPNSVLRVRREKKVMVHSGSQTRPGTGSLHPVAIRAAVEATRPLKPLVQKVVKATR